MITFFRATEICCLVFSETSLLFPILDYHSWLLLVFIAGGFRFNCRAYCFALGNIILVDFICIEPIDTKTVNQLIHLGLPTNIFSISFTSYPESSTKKY